MFFSCNFSLQKGILCILSNYKTRKKEEKEGENPDKQKNFHKKCLINNAIINHVLITK